jgi:yecA family protein
MIRHRLDRAEPQELAQGQAVGAAPLQAALAVDALEVADQVHAEVRGLSDLDGFLTGIAIGPEPVMPSEWLPAVWGGEEPVFDDAGQARTVIGTIMGRYDEILRALDTDPEATPRCSGRARTAR